MKTVEILETYNRAKHLSKDWRMGRDSNPRDDSSPSTHFPGVRLQPLGHPSDASTASTSGGTDRAGTLAKPVGRSNRQPARTAGRGPAAFPRLIQKRGRSKSPPDPKNREQPIALRPALVQHRRRKQRRAG